MPAGGRGARVTTAGLASARHFDGHLPLHGAVLESPAALGSRRTSPLGLSCSRYHQMLEDGLTSLSSSLRTLVASNLRAVRQRERGSSDEDLNHSVPAAVPPNAMARLPASVMAGTLGYYSL